MSEIRRLFSAEEIARFLDELEREKFLAPDELEPELEKLDEFDDQPGIGSPASGAAELLRFARIKEPLG